MYTNFNSCEGIELRPSGQKQPRIAVTARSGKKNANASLETKLLFLLSSLCCSVVYSTPVRESIVKRGKYRKTVFEQK